VEITPKKEKIKLSPGKEKGGKPDRVRKGRLLQKRMLRRREGIEKEENPDTILKCE